MRAMPRFPAEDDLAPDEWALGSGDDDTVSSPPATDGS
jgi:hypothetical protein